MLNDADMLLKAKLKRCFHYLFVSMISLSVMHARVDLPCVFRIVGYSITCPHVKNPKRMLMGYVDLM